MLESIDIAPREIQADEILGLPDEAEPKAPHDAVPETPDEEAAPRP